MKIEPFLVASTVNIIVAQRLVRKICEMCRSSQTMKREDLTQTTSRSNYRKAFWYGRINGRVYQGQGCKICHATGYVDRLGVFEILEVSKDIKKLITEKHDSDVILRKAIEEGMATMLDDGIDKVIKGLTTFEEVLRVTKVETL
jgi:type II secretory ATPase GspE/PulE/Tfp pilus assembly ATPase PilB-like protein